MLEILISITLFSVITIALYPFIMRLFTFPDMQNKQFIALSNCYNTLLNTSLDIQNTLSTMPLDAYNTAYCIEYDSSNNVCTKSVNEDNTTLWSDTDIKMMRSRHMNMDSITLEMQCGNDNMSLQMAIPYPLKRTL